MEGSLKKPRRPFVYLWAKSRPDEELSEKFGVMELTQEAGKEIVRCSQADETFTLRVWTPYGEAISLGKLVDYSKGAIESGEAPGREVASLYQFEFGIKDKELLETLLVCKDPVRDPREQYEDCWFDDQHFKSLSAYKWSGAIISIDKRGETLLKAPVEVYGPRGIRSLLCSKDKLILGGRFMKEEESPDAAPAVDPVIDSSCF